MSQTREEKLRELALKKYGDAATIKNDSAHTLHYARLLVSTTPVDSSRANMALQAALASILGKRA